MLIKTSLIKALDTLQYLELSLKKIIKLALHVIYDVYDRIMIYDYEKTLQS